MVAFEDGELETLKSAARRTPPEQSATISVDAKQAAQTFASRWHDQQPVFRFAIEQFISKPIDLFQDKSVKTTADNHPVSLPQISPVVQFSFCPPILFSASFI